VPRLKVVYIIEVHYPETEIKMLELRKRMGSFYFGFVQNYIKNLSISEERKNRLLLKVNNKLKENFKKYKDDIL